MIPQTRDSDATLTENNVYTTLHDYDEKQLYSLMHKETTIAGGNLIGVFLSGAAVTLGVSSILLLSSREAYLRRYYYFLCTYTVILPLLLVAVEIMAFINCNYNTIAFFWSFSKAREYGSRIGRASYTIQMLVAVLTDGLLAWRCFLVQRVLGRGSPKWYDLFWVFPACLFLLTIASGIVAVITGDDTKAAIMALASNVALNIHATLFITTRLLLHRRMVRTFVQNKKLASRHIYIVGILLESAAVNLPITIATAVGCGNRDTLENILSPIFAASQVLAAILIIHQTALGRVFSQQKEAEISKLMEKRDEERDTSGNVRSTIRGTAISVNRKYL